jgi:hypothetical protein
LSIAKLDKSIISTDKNILSLEYNILSSYDPICRYKREEIYLDTKETNLPHKIESTVDIDERN